MMPLSRKIAAGLVGAGLLALGGWYFHTPRRATRPIDAVPSDAFVAIEVDVGALRRSGTLTALFGERDEQSLTDVCGFDPVDQMEDLVFMVPEDGNGAFGVAVQASLTREQLTHCADEIIKAHGGDPTPDVVMRGDYAVVTPAKTSADSTKPPRSLGYLRGSPILVGPRSLLFSMIDALDDASSGQGAPGPHLAMRKELAEGITPPPRFLVSASAVLERSVRDRLKAELLKEVGTDADPGTAMMLGVLGMSRGAIGLYESGDEVKAVADLHCEEEPQCAQVERLVNKVRDQWAQMPALRAFGLGPVLDHLTAEHHGTALTLRAGAATTDVLHWAKMYLDSTKPLVAAVAEDKGEDVPTQTVHVTVPPGLKPGDPFVVKIPAPTQGAADAGVKNLIPYVVPRPHASGH